MKSMTTLLTALGISLLTLSSPVRAGGDDAAAVMKGFMGMMTAMQKQAGDDDPTGKAVLDAFSNAIDSKGGDRKGKGDRQRQGKGDRQGKGNRQGKGDRQGKGNRQARR